MLSKFAGIRCSAGSIVLAAVVVPGTTVNACIDEPLATPTMIIDVLRPCEAQLCFQGYVTVSSLAGEECGVAFDPSGVSCITSVEGVRINDAATGMPMPGWGAWTLLPRVGAGFDRIAEIFGEFDTAFVGYNTATDGDIAGGVAIEICVRVGTSVDCTPEELETELMAAGFLLGAADTNDDGELGSNVSIEGIAGVDEIVVDPCPADVDRSGEVNFVDILEVLSAWGPCTGICIADVECDGAVGFEEILAILGAWGPCPG